MAVSNGVLTIEKALGDNKYLYSLENSVAIGSIACAITSPAPAATLPQGTPVTITGTITVPGTVVVKLGSTTLGSATMVGLNWSYSWTPQVGDIGAQTINATATASVGGSTGNATGVAVTVSSASAAYASLLPGAYQVLQTDLGLTYGTTPKSSGGSQPVVTLGGTLTKDGAVPLWFKCTTGGAIGSGAVFSAYVDGTGTTPIMTGITPTAGTPIAITGSTVLSGMTVAWAAGTATLNNIWKATCSALADQSGNGKHATTASVAAQPIITIGMNGKCGLLFDGVDDQMDSTVGSLLTFPHLALVVARVVTSQPNANAIIGGNLFAGTISEKNAGAGIFQQYNGLANIEANLGAVFTPQRWAGKFTNSTADSLRVGSLTAVTGTNTGATLDNARMIGATFGGKYANMEFFALSYCPVQAYSAFDSALNSAPGYGVSSVAI